MLDLELTSQTTDFDSSSFSKYSQALPRLPLLQADLETAQHAHDVLQQVAPYVALVHGKKNPLAVDLLKQSAAKKEISEGTCKSLSNMHNCIQVSYNRKQKWPNAQQM